MKNAWLAAAVVGATALSGVGPVSAQAVRFDPGLNSGVQNMTEQVQFRNGRRFRSGGYGGYGGYRGGGYRRGGRGIGVGVGAGIAGLAAGAIIGGAIASQAAPAYGYGAPAYDPGYAPQPAYGGYAQPVQGGYAQNDGGSAYCAQRYRSYDPSSGTYLNNDGNRYPCP